MHRRKLPILDACGEDWGAMRQRDASTRECERCDRAVHNLSAMTRAAALRLLRESDAAGRGVCVRYVYDVRGELQFAPAVSRWDQLSNMAALASIALLVGGGLGCTSHEPYVINADSPRIVQQWAYEMTSDSDLRVDGPALEHVLAGLVPRTVEIPAMPSPSDRTVYETMGAFVESPPVELAELLEPDASRGEQRRARRAARRVKRSHASE